MKTTANAGLALGIFLVCLTLAGECQSLQAQSELHFRLVHNNLIVVSLKSGQEGPFDFILDTGADTTIVDPAIAPKLGFVRADRIQQSTLSGVQTVERGIIASLSAGSEQVDHVVVLVQDLSGLRKIDSHIVGIAGQNFLAHFNYLLDYRKHLARIEADNEIQDAIDGDHVPVDARENRMLVASEAQSRNHASLKLVLDSGAESVVLLHAASQALKVPREQSAMELTSAGQTALQMGRIHTLSVGQELLRDVVTTLPENDPGARIGDGLLPTSLFEAIYINNRDGFVVFNPHIKKHAHLE
jgi:predicted aspartyl protease